MNIRTKLNSSIDTIMKSNDSPEGKFTKLQELEKIVKKEKQAQAEREREEKAIWDATNTPQDRPQNSPKITFDEALPESLPAEYSTYLQAKYFETLIAQFLIAQNETTITGLRDDLLIKTLLQQNGDNWQEVRTVLEPFKKIGSNEIVTNITKTLDRFRYLYNYDKHSYLGNNKEHSEESFNYNYLLNHIRPITKILTSVQQAVQTNGNFEFTPEIKNILNPK